MCGRYVIYSDREYDELKNIVTETEESIYSKSGEIFPTDTAPVVIGNKLTFLKWGFYTFDKKLVINARSETLELKSMFKRPLIEKRCLIPANSYFEWKKEGDKPTQKVKYEIGINDRSLFFMAALYNTFTDKKNNSFTGFVVITTSANEDTCNVHDRMPAILEPGQENIWLDERINDFPILKSILKPYEENRMILTAV